MAPEGAAQPRPNELGRRNLQRRLRRRPLTVAARTAEGGAQDRRTERCECYWHRQFPRHEIQVVSTRSRRALRLLGLRPGFGRAGKHNVIQTEWVLVASTDATRFATQTQPEAGMFGAEREVFMAVPWPVFWERVEVIFARPLLFCLWGVALASSRVNLFGRGVGLYFMSSAGQAAMRLPKVFMALAILDPLSAVAWAVRFIEWVAARGRPLADGRGLARGRRRRRWQGWGGRRWWWWRWWWG